MRIERYYYTNAKKEQDKLEKKRKAAKQIPIERKQTTEQAVDAVLSKLFPDSAEIYTIADPKKFTRFREMAEIAIDLAEETGANLLIEAEEMTGCIIFVSEELGGRDEQKMILNTIGAISDEIYIRVSADTGEGSAIDLDGLVQLEFWFDLYRSVEKKE